MKEFNPLENKRIKKLVNEIETHSLNKQIENENGQLYEINKLKKEIEDLNLKLKIFEFHNKLSHNESNFQKHILKLKLENAEDKLKNILESN